MTRSDEKLQRLLLQFPKARLGTRDIRLINHSISRVHNPCMYIYTELGNVIQAAIARETGRREDRVGLRTFADYTRGVYMYICTS